MKSKRKQDSSDEKMRVLAKTWARRIRDSRRYNAGPLPQSHSRAQSEARSRVGDRDRAQSATDGHDPAQRNSERGEAEEEEVRRRREAHKKRKQEKRVKRGR